MSPNYNQDTQDCLGHDGGPELSGTMATHTGSVTPGLIVKNGHLNSHGLLQEGQ